MSRTMAKLPFFAALAVAALGLSPGAAANEQPANAAETWAVASETPDLGRPGKWTIGTRVEDIALPRRPGLAGPRRDMLSVRLFYPTDSASGTPARYRHELKPPKMAAVTVEEAGMAFDGAPPSTKQRFPLVVLSHGLGGWSTHFSRIAEILASHGYVVASIDHADASYEDVPGFLAAFGDVLLRRSHDQRAVLAAIGDGRGAKDLPIDRQASFGLLGYSMGGYGALGTAGAQYDQGAKPFAGLPPAARTALAVETAAAAPRLGAVALLAPWGGQPDSRAWRDADLARVRAPVLMIGGSNDTVVDYGNGLAWLFGHLTGSDRRMLTLREAGHNIAGNARPLRPETPPQILDWFGDPVWRSERLNQVIAHFLVAFFDAQLKKDKSAAAYLAVPTPDSNDGTWPMPFGELYDGQTAGDAQPGYWRGFHRGRAVGMTLEHRKIGE